jgi:hypothetical protein
VKVTIMFRGREMQHPELGRRILDEVAEHVAHVGRVETFPKQDGRNMTMVLGPDKKAQAAAVRRKDAETGADGAAPPSPTPSPAAGSGTGAAPGQAPTPRPSRPPAANRPPGPRGPSANGTGAQRPSEETA